MTKKAVCLISGGLDSAVTAFIAKKHGYELYALSFRYGQRHTKELSCAKKIAKAVRYSSGGYRYVKAMGFEIKERKIVQVSMNLVNYQKTSIFRVFETIKNEAERYGVPVIGSEIVGLVPLEALVDVGDHYLKLEDFKIDQVLEKKLLDVKK